jgi:hypothetical protein
MPLADGRRRRRRDGAAAGCGNDATTHQAARSGEAKVALQAPKRAGEIIVPDLSRLARPIPVRRSLPRSTSSPRTERDFHRPTAFVTTLNRRAEVEGRAA